MAQAEWQVKWGKLVAKTWQDDNLKKQLLNDPMPVLKAHGIELPAGMSAKIVENTDKLLHFPLPPKPSAHDLSEEQLSAVSGGQSKSCCASSFRG